MDNLWLENREGRACREKGGRGWRGGGKVCWSGDVGEMGGEPIC